MMTPVEMEEVLRSVDVRTATIERILPTLATKEDLKAFATKEDLKAFATKEDLKALATKEDLKGFATKEDLNGFATKEDLARAVAMLRGEIADSTRHALVLHEDLKSDMRMLAEHLAHVIDRLDRRP